MNKELENSDNRTELVRYLAGEMSPDEQVAFEYRLGKEPGLKSMLDDYSKIWDGVDNIRKQEHYDIDDEWSQLQNKINFIDSTRKKTAYFYKWLARRLHFQGLFPTVMSSKLSVFRLRSLKMRSLLSVNDDFSFHGARKLGSDKHNAENGVFLQTLDKEERVRIRSIRTTIIRIAAIFIFGMVGIFGYYLVRNLSSFERFEVADSTESVLLDDGSEVTLNHDSRLRYSIASEQSIRKVILQGEAFFDVAHDTSKPFVIDAGLAKVEVLGTSFNVDAYKDRSAIEVSVYSGIVSMSTQGKHSEKLILHAGNKGIYHKDKQLLELIVTDNKNDLAWKTRELYFSQTPLSEVIRVINEVYYTDIMIANERLADCPITVTFSKQKLSNVLLVLTNTLNIEMKREGGRIILDGEGCL